MDRQWLNRQGSAVAVIIFGTSESVNSYLLPFTACADSSYLKPSACDWCRVSSVGLSEW